MDTPHPPPNATNPEGPSGADREGFAAFERGDYRAARDIRESRAEAGATRAQIGMPATGLRCSVSGLHRHPCFLTDRAQGHV